MVDFSQVIDILLGNTPVEQVSDSRGNVLWSSAPVVLKNYFYVEDASGQANTLRILKGGGGSAPTVEVFCSTDRVNWTSMGSTSTTPITATVPANGKLYLKANTERFGGGWDGENNINCNASFNVGGNIMSMLNGDNFEGSTFAPNTTHNFGCMFKWSNVVDASNLVLPDTVTSYCYWGCFYGCASLTKAPVLPATIMAEECYNAMFYGCGSLTTTPALPATTLANNCYFGMFNGCGSLTSVPVLPATTLATGCYSYMFQGCLMLNRIVTYAQDISANNCVFNWLLDASATGDFYNMACTTYPSGTSGIPSGWTEHHTTASTIDVTITNTSNYSSATYQIDSGTEQPINVTGTTSFTVPATATSLTVNRNGRGVTDILGVCGITSDSEFTTVIPVGKMSDNVSIDLVNLM